MFLPKQSSTLKTNKGHAKIYIPGTWVSNQIDDCMEKGLDHESTTHNGSLKCYWTQNGLL